MRSKYTWVMNYRDIFWYKSSFTLIIFSIHVSSYEGFASEAWTSGLYCWNNVYKVANGRVLRVVKERSFVHSNHSLICKDSGTKTIPAVRQKRSCDCPTVLVLEQAIRNSSIVFTFITPSSQVPIPISTFPNMT